MENQRQVERHSSLKAYQMDASLWASLKPPTAVGELFHTQPEKCDQGGLLTASLPRFRVSLSIRLRARSGVPLLHYAGKSKPINIAMIAMTTNPAPLKVFVPSVIVTPVAEPSTSATIVTGIPTIAGSRASVISPSRV